MSKEKDQHHHKLDCITGISEDRDGKAFVVYLANGRKITVGRDARTKGPAWLIISDQLQIKAASQ